MASINKAIIVGFVGQEPKIDTLQSGVKIASFSVATTEKGYTTQSGTTIPDRTEWHSIVIMQMLDRKSDGGNQQQYIGQSANSSGGSTNPEDDDLPF